MTEQFSPFRPTDHGIYNYALKADKEAFLYLISPTRFSDQANRSLIYRFDGKFLEKADRAINASSNSMTGENLHKAVTDTDILTAAVPSANAVFKTDLNRLSDFWTFILVVNNDEDVDASTRTFNNNRKRVVYNGLCLDEPVSMLTGSPVPNLNTPFLILHKTIAEQVRTVSPNGGQESTRVFSDVDVVPGKTLQGMSTVLTKEPSQNLYFMRPYDLSATTSLSNDGSVLTALGDFSSLGSSPESTAINSRLSVPRYNLYHVLRSVADAQTDIMTDSVSGSLQPPRILGSDMLSDRITENMMDPTVLTHKVGLDPNTYVTMSEILQKYNPKILPINIPKTSMYGTIDQNIISASNQYSSLLSSVLPSVLANNALSLFVFTYNSYADRTGQFGDGLVVHKADPLIQINNDELSWRIQSVKNTLRREVFPVLIAGRGDFELNASCSCNGITTINLNFMDDTASDAIYEIPNILGGFNNNLIGSHNITDYNSTNIAKLINVLTDTGPVYNEDVREDMAFQANLYNAGYGQQQTPVQQTYNNYTDMNNYSGVASLRTQQPHIPTPQNIPSIPTIPNPAIPQHQIAQDRSSYSRFAMNITSSTDTRWDD